MTATVNSIFFIIPAENVGVERLDRYSGRPFFFSSSLCNRFTPDAISCFSRVNVQSTPGVFSNGLFRGGRAA